MAKDLLKRLERLEAARSKAAPDQRVHRLILPDDVDSQAHIDRMIAAGSALADDLFIIRRIVTGVPRAGALA